MNLWRAALPSCASSVTFAVALSSSPCSCLPGFSACHCSWRWFIATSIRALSPSSPSAVAVLCPSFSSCFLSSVFFSSLFLWSCLHSFFNFISISFSQHSPLFVLSPLLIQLRRDSETQGQEIYWDKLISQTTFSGLTSPTFTLSPNALFCVRARACVHVSQLFTIPILDAFTDFIIALMARSLLGVRCPETLVTAAGLDTSPAACTCGCRIEQTLYWQLSVLYLFSGSSPAVCISFLNGPHQRGCAFQVDVTLICAPHAGLTH